MNLNFTYIVLGALIVLAVAGGGSDDGVAKRIGR